MAYREGSDFTCTCAPREIYSSPICIAPKLTELIQGDDADLVIWTAIEPAVGILCACFPVIAPAFNRSTIKIRFGSGPGGSFVRRVFRSKTSQKGNTDDSIPLSTVSSPYTSAKEKTSHPFRQLSASSDKDGRFVIQSNVSQPSSVVGTQQVYVPEYEADGALPALPHETVRTKSDAEWVAKYPHRQA